MAFLCKVIFRIVVALCALAGILALWQYLDEQKADYIEIYNDNGLDDEYC